MQSGLWVSWKPRKLLASKSSVTSDAGNQGLQVIWVISKDKGIVDIDEDACGFRGADAVE